MKNYLFVLVTLSVFGCETKRTQPISESSPSAVLEGSNSSLQPEQASEGEVKREVYPERVDFFVSRSSDPNKFIPEDFQDFWITFRQHVVHESYHDLRAFFKFPFVTRGTLDHDPEITFSPSEIEELLKAYLSSVEYVRTQQSPDIIQLTEYQIIHQLDTLSENMVFSFWGDAARIGDIQFEKDSVWKATFMYYDTEAAKILKGE